MFRIRQLISSIPNSWKCRIFIRRIFLLLLGSVLAAAGLEFFLVPNHVIDGGIVGLSIMGEAGIGIPFSILLLALNAPFVILSICRVGWRFALFGCFATFLLSIFSAWFSYFSPVTNDPFLAAIFGGIIDGLGVGLVIKAGGFLDGSDVVAILADRNSVFSVGEVEMFLNFFILGGSGFLFGWDHAMYSLFAYYIISKMIDVAVKGINESYIVMIVTDEYDDVAKALMDEMNRGVTLLHGEGGFTGEQKKILYTTMTRFEIDQMKDIVSGIDSNAFITLSSAADIVGGRFSKKHSSFSC